MDRRPSSIGGEPTLFVALPASQGRVVRLAHPEASVSERLGQIRIAVITAAGLAGLIGIALVWLISRRLTRPLQRMTEAAESVAAGDLTVRVPGDTTRELDLMAGAFNHMAAELERRIEASEGQARLLDQVLGCRASGGRGRRRGRPDPVLEPRRGSHDPPTAEPRGDDSPWVADPRQRSENRRGEDRGPFRLRELRLASSRRPPALSLGIEGSCWP